MGHRRQRRPRPPLDRDKLNELALTYVGRFATTRARLGDYLARKVRERGWDGDRPPQIEDVVERLASLGYVDDEAYALSKARSLGARGYGLRRVNESLRAAGIEEQDGESARELAEEERVDSALRFAQRRRIGPFAAEKPDRAGHERALAAMVRAGHSFAIAKAILSLEPERGTPVEILREKAFALL
jgi:regulatory protein